MLTVTELASIGFVSVVTALAGCYGSPQIRLLARQLALSVPGCVLLNEALKYVFHRARPTLEHSLVELPSYSFPSGHALAATVFYGFAAILLWSYIAPKVCRVVIGTAGVSGILLVGFRWVFLGAPFPPGVLGGVG